MATPHLLALFTVDGSVPVSARVATPGPARRRSDVAPLQPGYDHSSRLCRSPPPCPPPRRRRFPRRSAIRRRGLTDADLARIAAALGATHAESTRTVYGYAWRRWAALVRTTAGSPRCPATPPRCAPTSPNAPSTGRHHGHPRRRLLGDRAPAPHPRRRRPGRPRGGPRRSAADCAAPTDRAPRRQARPLSVADLRQIVPPSTGAPPIGVRDTAIILLGYAGALRRSELVALTLADLEPKPGRTAAAPAPLQDRPRGPRPGRRHRPRPARRSPTRSPRSTPGSPSAARRPDRCSPASAARDPRCTRSPATPSPACSRTAPGPPDSPATGSPPTPCAPDTPPPPPWPASPSTGSPPRPDTADIYVLVERYIRPVEALQTTSSRDLGL